MTEKRRKHSPEFKHEAVKLVTVEGYTIAEAAKSLGLNANMLGRWKRELEAKQEHAFPGNGNQSGQEAEMKRLKEENRRLKMERDILKKATAFFAKEMV
jgi:transposase